MKKSSTPAVFAPAETAPAIFIAKRNGSRDTGLCCNGIEAACMRLLDDRVGRIELWHAGVTACDRAQHIHLPWVSKGMTDAVYWTSSRPWARKSL
jgi:hypothetical protein